MKMYLSSYSSPFYRIVFLLLLILFLPYDALLGQKNDTHITSIDSSNLKNALLHGKISGHSRLHFMATENFGKLKDYSANAASLQLKYETGKFYHFQAGIAGSVVANLFSSAITIPDQFTNQASRYEAGLFDLYDPGRKIIPRLNELYIKYSRSELQITFGKQLFKSPFINPQDGRMQPTLVEGLTGKGRLLKNFEWQAGWLYQISPRGTGQWFSTGKSLGIYSQGLDIYGSRGNYYNNINSAGIGLVGIEYKYKDQLKVKIWEQLVENVFNTILIQPEYEIQMENLKLNLALQYIHQDPLNEGGNNDSLKTYFPKNNHSNIFGGKAGITNGDWEFSVNYTRITKDGKFLMPREWGIEPVFTFQVRERNEGLGDVHAFSVNLKRYFFEKQFLFDIGYGNYYLPKVNNYSLNKYGMPSYNHYKFLGQYIFSKKLQGLEIAAIVVYKSRLDKSDIPLVNVINRVNMTNASLIVDFRF